MALIRDLLDRVEIRLALAQGLDVQIHAEERIVEIIRHKYTVLFDQMWWDDYMTLEQFNLDGSTGTITDDISDRIYRFIDIHSVFLNKNKHPLPFISRGVNPSTISMNCVAPYAVDPTKMFRILPVATSGTLYVWYRTPLQATAWTDSELATNVNMDSEMLILGSCYDFLVDDGTNADAAEKFKVLFDARFNQLATLEHQQALSKSDMASSAVPDDWYVNGP